MHLHHILFIIVRFTKGDLLSRVRRRMSEERLDQRALATRLHTTQGHLSKLLRGHFKRRSKIVRELEAFADRADTSQAHSRLLAACLRVARRSPRHMHFVTSLMRFVDELSDDFTAKPSERARRR